MLFQLFASLLFTLSLAPPITVLAATFPDPLVHLSYGSFQGKYNAAYNISYFRKIPFAAPPTGQNRFRAPQPVADVKESIYDSDATFNMCPQKASAGNEDCLYLSVYSRPFSETTLKKRPVMVFFYGGGFIQGSASTSLVMPPSTYPVLNVSDENDYIAVYPNYRVNAFGFLPGKKIKESPTSDLNPGLLDQQAALQWVNKYISHFNGDPENVTIWGQSAGGGSVVAQVIANNGKTSPKLFSKAIMSSPFWPKAYRYDSRQAEELYSMLVEHTGCNTAQDDLECLKSVQVQKILDANQIITKSHTYTTSSFTWAPVLDDEFLNNPLSEATKEGKINAEMALGMYNRFEGSTFVPSSLNHDTGVLNSTDEGFRFWLQGFLPDLDSVDYQNVEKLYPRPKESGEYTYTTMQDRAGFIYRDVVLACPAFWVSTAASQKSTGYLGEYTIPPAKHASDVGYWNTVNNLQETQPFQYKSYAGSYASFIQTGDPNAHKPTDSSNWPEIVDRREWVMASDGFSTTSLETLEGRCGYWGGLGGKVPV